MSNGKQKSLRQGLRLSYRGKHRRSSVAKRALAATVAFATAFTPLVLMATQPASAYTIGSSFNLTDPNASGFGVYIDAPQVQNSYVNADPATSASTQLETFNLAPTSDVGNGLNVGSCPETIAGGAVSGGCTIYGGAAEPDLGASTTSGDPAFGGQGSQFASAESSGTVIEFANSQKYLGLWWAAGSPGNQIDFYSQGVLVSSITTSDLDALLGAPPTSSTADRNVLTAINGTTYEKNYYYGNPRGYSSAPPTSTLHGTLYVPTETYSYIHAFANGSTSFDKVVLSGNGFEFDNFVTSTLTLQPIGRLVPYSFYEAQRKVTFDKNAIDATGVMDQQTGLTTSNLGEFGFNRPGYIFTGWNTAPDGSGTAYQDGGEYSFSTDLTLYAQWQIWDGRPIISGLNIRVNEANYEYSRPDGDHGLDIDWRGQSPLAGDEYWFLCSNHHTSPADYFLNAFPTDCVDYPYVTLPGGAPGNVDFPLSHMVLGKYVAYGMWAQNASGISFAIQSAPNPVNLTIDGLARNGSLSRTAYTISGYPTSTTSGWFRCDNPFVDDVTMPTGTCTSVNSNALTFSPATEDFGKYMVYKVEAEISGTTLSARKIVNGGQAVAPAPPTQSGNSGGNSPAPVVSPSPSAPSNPLPSAPAEPKPTSAPRDSNNTDANSSTKKQSASGLVVKYPSGEVEKLEDVVVPPTVVAAPLISIPKESNGFSLNSFADPVGNPAIGAPGVDGQAPEKFVALSSPQSSKSFTENLGQLFAMLAGLTLAGVASTRAASRRKMAGAVPGNVDTSRDPFSSSAKAWGDKLPVWRLSLSTFLDKPSMWLTMKSAKISPLVSKISNDGSYLRAIFGSLTVVAPIASALIAIYAVQTSGGLIANTAWTALLLLSCIAIFDALAGLVGILAYAISFWAIAEHTDVWLDIRVLLGTALVIIGPSLLMTAFRTIRRQAALGTHLWWERVSDLAIGPFISGWSVSIFVSALPAISGMTLSVANHVLLFAVIIALTAVLRVLAEEFAAQTYPHRMDKLTPDEIPDAPRIQKALSLTVRYLFWVFMAAGVLGNTWQLWVGSAIVLIPQILSWFEDEVPNSPTIWRWLPTGVPGLAFGLLVTGWSTSVLSYLVISSAHLAKWAFVILPMPLIVFALLASFGRFGETQHEIKPAMRNKFVYRIGGIVMLAITMRLAGVV